MEKTSQKQIKAYLEQFQAWQRECPATADIRVEISHGVEPISKRKLYQATLHIWLLDNETGKTKRDESGELIHYVYDVRIYNSKAENDKIVAECKKVLVLLTTI